MINRPFIGIAGNIGVGKTTMTEKLCKELNWNPIFESVVDNPYLEDFYSNMSRWSFNLQVYFLHNRLSNQIKLMKDGNSFIQDRTIYEDREIFALNLYKNGSMSKRDWDTYNNLFNYMSSFVPEPALIIYLQANTDTLMSRIKNRKRDFEKDMSAEYLHSLNIYYEKWISKLSKDKVMIINTDNFNIFKDVDQFKQIVCKIRNSINE